MTLARTLLLSIAALTLACEVRVVPGDQTPDPATRIQGTIDLADFGDVPEGDAVLLRYDCDAPPPPEGAGMPVDFLLVGEDSFDHGRASFVFSSVPPESCSVVTGFIDRDDDFHYALGVTAQPTAGDLALSSAERSVGSVEDDIDFIPPPADVLLRATRLYETDRPAFRLGVEATEIPMMVVGDEPLSTPAVRVDLLATTFSTELVNLDEPSFDVVFGADEDGDGLPDDDNGDGLPDVDWPRIVLQRLDPDDPTAASLAEPPVALVGVVLALDPEAPPTEYNLLAAAQGAGVPFDGESILPALELRLYVPGLVLLSFPLLDADPIETAASAGTEVEGAYRITVLNPDGRLWQMPNELAALGVPSQAGFFGVAVSSP